MRADDRFMPRCLRAACVLIAAGAVALSTSPARAQILKQQDEVRELQGVTVNEKLGDQIPLNLEFTNAQGELITIDRYFDGEKPVILVLAYYRCPIVCPLTLDQLAGTLNEIDQVVGEDFNVVVVSFDHTESTSAAYGKEILYESGYKQGTNGGDTPEIRAGWNFHTSDVSNVRLLANSVGYQYRLLDNGEYSHPVALVVLSGEGKVMRYLYGYDYPPRDMTFSLLEASEGRVARSLGDLIGGFCFRYDPTSGTYTIQAFRVMQLGGIVTVIALTLFIGGMLLVERLKARRLRLAGGPAAHHASHANRTNPSQANPAHAKARFASGAPTGTHA
ncbi:MAG: SCO family protein [Planctomycetota bacterium]